MTLFARLALLLALICWPPQPAAAQDAATRLDGRWNLSLQTPQGTFPAPVEFIVRDGGRVTANMLGPSGSFRITDASGTLSRDRLRLSVRSSYGALRVNARVQGGRLSGRWSPSGLISGLLFRGRIDGARDDRYVRAAPAEVYERVWSQIARHFYAPDYNGIDVAALRERYRPQVIASRSDGELAATMRRMLAEFGTSHLLFFATPAPVDQPPAASPEAEISWRRLAPGIGYLRIRSFEDGPAVIARIDRAFAELGSYESLVIDVRENGGGSLGAAMRLGDHIFPERRPVGYFASRRGLESRGFRSIDALDVGTLPLFTGYHADELFRDMTGAGAVMLTTGGRVPQPYRGRIALLIDEYCFSACEAFASVARETSAATLFGRRTTGAMLAAFPYDAGGGWMLMLPAWDFRTPSGVKVEGRGVEPHVRIRAGSGDPELAAALHFLRSPAPGAR